jgi:hypothetical protein
MEKDHLYAYISKTVVWHLKKTVVWPARSWSINNLIYCRGLKSRIFRSGHGEGFATGAYSGHGWSWVGWIGGVEKGLHLRRRLEPRPLLLVHVHPKPGIEANSRVLAGEEGTTRTWWRRGGCRRAVGRPTAGRRRCWRRRRAAGRPPDWTTDEGGQTCRVGCRGCRDDGQKPSNSGLVRRWRRPAGDL